MPLRGLKHSVPYSRQAQSVYGMIKFLLKNSAGSADNMSCVNSFSDVRQARERSLFRLPRGEKEAGCHSIKHQPSSHPVGISVWGKAAFEDSSGPAFPLFPCLPIVLCSFGRWLPPQQLQPPGHHPNCTSDWLSGNRQSRNFCARARWTFGSTGSCQEQSQHQRCSGAFPRLPKETADPHLH